MIKMNDISDPIMRKAESEWDRPASVEFRKEWVVFDYRMLDEKENIIEGKGFALENYSDPHYGLEFHTRDDLNHFINLLNSAADKVWKKT